MLNDKRSKPMLISTKNNMIRFYKYFAIALVALISNVALGQNTITLNNSKKVSCLGGSDGIIEVNVTGFTPTSYILTSLTFPTITKNSTVTQIDFDNLPKGTYTIEATDGINSEIANIDVEQIPTLKILGYTAVNVSCFSYSDGEVDIDNIDGGTAPYQYSFHSSPYGNDPVFKSQQAGTYSISIKDKNGCIANSNAIIGTPTKITSTVTQTNVLCNGKLTGALDITASGGSGTYSKYTWTSVLSGFPKSTEDLTGLAVGTYDVEIEDNKGCKGTSSYTITEPSALTATPTAKDLKCFNDNSGEISLQVSGGTPGYTYEWSGPTGFTPTTQDVSGLAAYNSYSVKIKDANSCELTLNSIVVKEPAKIESTVSQTNVLCNGNSTGALDITASGGSGSYNKYTWTSVLSGFPKSTEDLTGLAAGTYDVEIEDDKGCKGTSSYTITEPSALTATPTAKDLKCFNDNSGEISLSVSGGKPGYTYEWSGPTGFSPTTQNVSGLAADNNYSVKIKDANLCELTLSSIVVKEPLKLEASAVVTDVDCNGASTGAIDLTATGGTSPISYSWIGPGTYSAITDDITSLIAGDYEVTVTDDNGCIVVNKSTVKEPTKLSISEVVTEVDCNGAATGEIDVTTTGGTTPYDFQWDDSPINTTTEDILGLKAGDYEITVVDAKGCIEIKTITVSEPSIISITETHVDNVCNGDALGEIDATVTGGTLAVGNSYKYEWTESSNPVDITEDLINLAAGTYDLKVTDDNSCVMNLSVAISEPTLISATGFVTDVKCFKGKDGEITLSISGGTVAGSSKYLVDWTGPALYTASTQDITSLYAGDYDYTITDDNNCQITGKLTVSEPTELVLSTTPSSICDGSGQISFSATGGTSATGDYIFEVDGVISTSPVVNLFDNVYIVKAIDDNACEDTIHTLVKHVDPILPTVKTRTKVVYLNSAGKGSILTTDIDNGSTDNCGVKSLALDKLNFECTDVGRYIVTLTVTDINDNVSSDTASVFIKDTISPTLTVVDKVIPIDFSGFAYLNTGMVVTDSADNCDIGTIVLSKSKFDLANVGDNTVDVTITDIHGNSTTKKIKVNVFIQDLDKDSIPDYIEKNIDTDGDGTMNYLDFDSDNDAISDLVENDSMKSYVGQDFDGDGIPNALDLDSDDDGINDIVEVDLGDMDANGNGQTDNPIIVGLPNDKDGDGKPDYLDLDSDGDGIFDVVESLEKYVDADTDGKVDGTDADNDGIKDAADGFNGWADAGDKRPANSDNDITEDWRDTDSDNDLINDAIEGVVDTDGDLKPNYLDIDSDDDGITDLIETATDSDSDSKGNYIDTDSDEDGILDKTEGTADPDGDTKGNWLDDDSDGDGISDKIETDSDADNDTNPNYLDLDSDGDGISDQEEGTADPDGDSKGNWLDDDSDGDGILDLNETNADYDGDGIKNYLDDDSDDDELKDAIEGELDLDKNGKKDFLDPQYVIPEGFSPNGDGVNDLFYITGLRVYKEAQFIVINQWGQIVFESGLGYANNWDGTFGGSGLKFGSGVVPEGIYYFVFKPNKFNMPNITGNIYIKP
jgi:gliding motility-associated-like protein